MITMIMITMIMKTMIMNDNNDNDNRRERDYGDDIDENNNYNG